ncbi:MAG: nucleotidyltransferase domain-containing protein [Nitrospirae bacterium]|nr:nucleotidyltransferase domain-containing protein [Nitrospirota bacterium]MBF0540322.1 nucleotidyltransferase domain-containing protein [Nitrospirota bacterium]
MEILSIEDILLYLRNNKRFFYEDFGVTRMGIFGSFTRGQQTLSSDIDMVIEIEPKNIHSFMKFKRFLEKELSSKIDMGFEHSLKPIIKDKIKGQIIYV